MNATSLDLDLDLARLKDLTERYARYSRGAGGLSLVIGGVLLTASFFASAYLELSLALRVLLVAFPAIWLLSKELLRRFYYQRGGAVLQQVSPALRRKRWWMSLYLFLVCGFIAAMVLTVSVVVLLEDGSLPPPELVAYIALIVATPFAARRWFWSTGDFLVGTLLFTQAALVAGGVSHTGPWWVLYATGCAVFAIGTGVVEHRAYLKIRASLDGRGQS